MPYVQVSPAIQLNYEDQGDKSAPVIILIMGLGAQMTVWPDALYIGLVEKGFRVIRFDNRDVGLSSQLNHLGTPSLLRTWVSKRLHTPSPIPYQLEDMAKDVVGLMKALKIKKAHLVGASMGGMIAKIIAAKHKKKVLSLTSLMSTSSYSTMARPKLSVLLQLANRPRKTNREAAIQYNIKLNRIIGSPRYPTDDQQLAEQATFNVNRAYHPAGFKRQLIAITQSGNKQNLLRKIKAPTLVIHGTDDPIIPFTSGQQTAEAIRKAKLKLVEGMGHDFPSQLMKKMTKWIAKHVKKAERKRLAKTKLKY